MASIPTWKGEEMVRYFVETWGCQMNDHDSEKMAGILESQGMTPAESPESADIYILNTCSVREKAAEKVFSRLGVLRSIKSVRPDFIIGVAGCVAQQEGDRIFSRAPYVDFVMGTQNLHHLPQLLDELRTHSGRPRRIQPDPAYHLRPVGPIRRQHKLKGFITITEGCDNHCTYCIVPTTRGVERSRPFPLIMEEARQLVAQGCREIELLGQNVNSYQSDTDFKGLLQALATLPELWCVRFISPHPRDFDEACIRLIKQVPNLSRHIHLPAQSGSTAVLKRMGRGYTREDYLQKVKLIRAHLGQQCSLTSDFIVGFPGESDADFEATLSLIQEVRYDGAFSFVYSPRPGTAALKLADNLGLTEKKHRLARLQALQDQMQVQNMQARIGQETRILVDQIDPKARFPLAGRTRDNILVHVESGPANPQRFWGHQARVQITGCGTHTLRGTLLSSP